MLREKTNAGMLGQLLRFSAALAANSTELEHLEGMRLRLASLVDEAQEIARQQAALAASKQAALRQIDHQQDQHDQHQPRGPAGGVPLMAGFDPQLFEVAAQRAVRFLHLLRERSHTAAQPDEGFSRPRGIGDLRERTGSLLSAFREPEDGVGKRLPLTAVRLALLCEIRPQLGEDLGLQAGAGFGQRVVEAGGGHSVIGGVRPLYRTRSSAPIEKIRSRS
jgi:hypothetical protein